tara:strand:+ start:165 stop:416 length:252 start_codon:yes stop_codon:yes gene_type:complete
MMRLGDDKKLSKGDLILLRGLDHRATDMKEIGIIIAAYEDEVGFEDDHWYYFKYTVFCKRGIMHITDHHIEKILSPYKNDEKL